MLFKLNYNWLYCSAISLAVVMLCVCTKRLCVCNNELACKAVWLAFSCQTSAIPLPIILIPWYRLTGSMYYYCRDVDYILGGEEYLTFSHCTVNSGAAMDPKWVYNMVSQWLFLNQPIIIVSRNLKIVSRSGCFVGKIDLWIPFIPLIRVE